MANNPYVNKVEYAGQTLMDLTGDTATPSDVLNGATFHDRSGTPKTGSLITHNVYDGLDSTSTDDALSANQGKVLNEDIASRAKVIVKETFANTETTKTYTLTGGHIYLLIGGHPYSDGYLAICNCWFAGSRRVVVVNASAKLTATMSASNTILTVTSTGNMWFTIVDLGLFQV